jgi:heat shock protein HslJ
MSFGRYKCHFYGRLAALIVTCVVVGACAGTGDPLAGTDWQLVELQSMDDSIGAIRPEDPARFTMRLNADGTVNMRLDCNRATGTWSSEASASGEGGSFSFGTLATTRALCPPPNLDERIARDAEYVRSYFLKDGRLYLSLMADAGIYAWEPAASK